MKRLKWHRFFISHITEMKNSINNFALFGNFELYMSITFNYDIELSKHLIASLNSFSWYKEFPFINHELKPFNEDSSRDLSKHLIASSYNFFLYNDIPAIYHWSTDPEPSDITRIIFYKVINKDFVVYWLLFAFIG